MDAALAGAIAGLYVDISLYPIDTIKTRMQSKGGFVHAGGFRGVYKGLSMVTISSIPCGALFFTGYDQTKAWRTTHKAHRHSQNNTSSSISYTTARRPPMVGLSVLDLTLCAWVGEILACLVRVPSDMVKQRLQTQKTSGTRGMGIGGVVQAILSEHNNRPLSLYKGMPITLCRDLPFVAVQMSLYEYLKAAAVDRDGAVSHNTAFILGSGAVAGGVAAFVTTPLDVARTRINLGQSASGNVAVTLGEIWTQGGVREMFRGASTRVMWISAGGAVFFATYETAKAMLNGGDASKSR